MKQSYYRDKERKVVGSAYPWGDDDPRFAEPSLCEVIPFPQESNSSRATWDFSRSDTLFAIALTGIVTTLICLAPAFLSSII